MNCKEMTAQKRGGSFSKRVVGTASHTTHVRFPLSRIRLPKAQRPKGMRWEDESICLVTTNKILRFYYFVQNAYVYSPRIDSSFLKVSEVPHTTSDLTGLVSMYPTNTMGTPDGQNGHFTNKLPHATRVTMAEGSTVLEICGSKPQHSG